MVTKCRLESRHLPANRSSSEPEDAGASPRGAPLRLLRLPQVMDMTGLGRTKIYALQAEGSFPMRVQITPCCVGWVEQEIQAWISKRIAARAALLATIAVRTGRPRRSVLQTLRSSLSLRIAASC